MFAIGVIAASLAAVAYGLSTVLRALGAQRAARTQGEAASAKSTLAAFTDPAFLMGTLLVMIGFFGGGVAARMLPLFLSQTIVAANLVITALLGTVLLGTTLRGRDWAAIFLVVGALCMLGASAGHEATTKASFTFHWWLFGITTALAVVGLVVLTLLKQRGALFGGALSGVMYGALAVAARVLEGIHPFDLLTLITDPAAWTIAIGGAVAFYVQTVALQLGPVNAVTAVLVVGETGGPSIIGVLFLGDKAVDGLQWMAYVGFVGAIVGAVTVAWLTTIDDPSSSTTAGAAEPKRRTPLLKGADTAT
ncbi:hypothetical protein [Gordonia sp. NB41Y]|uniref:hypothetical protein n=1 Tax=Gordonia sp. NB41Y TaxID=875808 RepID=UPI0002BE9BF2|nr:hypothetical protein [Gordonia sp. NB41Y]WLP88823.1 hypothetical protein Q9K23_14520 [Gordonia sp. NB41Y]